MPAAWQHKVLFWGILGALVMRLAMIGVGAALVSRFNWVLYFFGAFLIFTGIKMAFGRGAQIHPQHNPMARWFRKWVPVTRDYKQDNFVVRERGRWVATPLLVVLVCVEATDLMFATDSIPAIFAVTLDPFIVYTSNVFAILGLRSLYFVLAGAMNLFRHLKLGLGVVLVFIGIKMLLAHTAWKIDTLPALLVVATVLAISIIASLVANRCERREQSHRQTLLNHPRTNANRFRASTKQPLSMKKRFSPRPAVKCFSTCGVSGMDYRKRVATLNENKMSHAAESATGNKRKVELRARS